MNSYVYGGWSALELAVPKMMTVESATLVVLAASLLVFRTFRERYLLIWIVGWLAYFKDTEGSIFGIMQADK